jgi:hypothetical protein
MRVAAKVDANQTVIIKALREVGNADADGAVSVWSLAGQHHGCPDLLVGIEGEPGKGRTYLVEVKDGGKVPSKQLLTKDQKRFIEQWRGSPVVILTTPEQAQAWAMNTLQKQRREQATWQTVMNTSNAITS